MRLKTRGPRAASLLLSLCAALGSAPASALDLSTRLGALAPADQAIDDSVQTPVALEASTQLDGEFVVDLVISDALSMLGTDYQLGATDDGKVDCSSLVQRIFRVIGLDVPRTTRQQVGYGEPVELSDLRKGDLLFYRWQPRNLHVAVYMDDGYILHASPGQGRVVVTRLTPSWERRLVAARRVI
ncbi:C40 family peptidase [Solimonas fluminis]|nr:C40 family peptidase [Solimonas fluminis]